MKRNTGKDKPYMSDPVIDRGGKIGRVPAEEPLSAKKNKKDEIKEENVRSVEPAGQLGDLSISDGEFLGSKAVKTKKNRGIHTVKSGVRRPFPVVTLIASVICTLLFMSLIFNFVRINEFTKDISEMSAEVGRLEKKKDELTSRLDEKNSVEELKKYIEQRAESMGMVEEGKMNPPVAVTPEKTEKINEYDVPEESDAVFTTVLNALAKNFFDVIDAFTGE
ncbi:MAG: hypothetical protein IJU52_07200 [Clostridia bacterium]|nr:hypothetical protein [Clostridia bacterium]